MTAGADQRIAARRLAMDLLARREHSRFELQRKLARREFSEAIVNTVLNELQADGLLDEQRFAEAFVRSRVGRGKGPLKVRADLVARGVDDNLAGEVLAASAVDWASLAAEALIKRFGNAPAGTAAGDFKARARCMRFLAQRGFTSGQSRVALAKARHVNDSALDDEI